FYLFFFSSRRRHTRSKRDWSSDVCSSDLPPNALNNLNHKNQRCSRPLCSSQATDDPTTNARSHTRQPAGRTTKQPTQRFVAREPNSVPPPPASHTDSAGSEGVVIDVPPMSNHPTHIRRRRGTLTPPTPQQGQRVSCSLERR